MQAINSGCVRARLILLGTSLFGTSLFLSSCAAQPSSQPPIDIQLFQKWQLQPGDTIAGHTVLGGLGDISIALKGSPVYAPFDGEAQVDKRGCVFFSTAEIRPTNFGFVGLTRPNSANCAKATRSARATRCSLLRFANSQTALGRSSNLLKAF